MTTMQRRQTSFTIVSSDYSVLTNQSETNLSYMEYNDFLHEIFLGPTIVY